MMMMMKCSFISYGYTLQSDVHIPNHQRAGQMHTQHLRSLTCPITGWLLAKPIVLKWMAQPRVRSFSCLMQLTQ